MFEESEREEAKRKVAVKYVVIPVPAILNHEPSVRGATLPLESTGVGSSVPESNDVFGERGSCLTGNANHNLPELSVGTAPGEPLDQTGCDCARISARSEATAAAALEPDCGKLMEGLESPPLRGASLPIMSAGVESSVPDSDDDDRVSCWIGNEDLCESELSVGTAPGDPLVFNDSAGLACSACEVPTTARPDYDRGRLVRMLEIFLGSAFEDDISEAAALDFRALLHFEGSDMRGELTRICDLHDARAVWAEFAMDDIRETEAQEIFSRDLEVVRANTAHDIWLAIPWSAACS